MPIHNPIKLLFARFGWALFTSTTIALFKDDDGKTNYSVLVYDTKKDSMVEKMLPLSSLPRLTAKATGMATQDVAGEKHGLQDSEDVKAELSDTGDVADSSSSPDIGELGLNDADAGDLVYSVRTGQMERYDNDAEIDDCSLSAHFSRSSRDPFSDLSSDDSEPPRKKSRSSSIDDIVEGSRPLRSKSGSKESVSAEDRSPSKWSS
ncbi:hypothetical protein K445DRAFT_18948 [Daldinia sp. EC12]|nr:hypothetical protein F4774DRAFT_134099 [Daldinia eschscholtzii]OTB19342.1 hypothetical protein K445DRAFT_18948 [Daldinia sp. EC12]